MKKLPGDDDRKPGGGGGHAGGWSRGRLIAHEPALLQGHARCLGDPASDRRWGRNSRRQARDETVKKGDKIWFTDWRGVRRAGVITNCESLKGRPVFDISVDDEPQTRRCYTWQITPRD